MDNYIIIIPQEFKTSNHIELWKEMAKQTSGRVIVMDISADFVVSVLKHKYFRIKEAWGKAEVILNNLYRLRALYPIRPELSTFPSVKLYSFLFWRRLKCEFPQIMQENVYLLNYDPVWGKILYGSHPRMTMGYYLIDEVRRNANNDTIDKKAFQNDEYTCKKSDFILTMTDILAESRLEYNRNIDVIGNGAIVCLDRVKDAYRFEKSVAFIGNFRDWVDVELLTALIKKRRDLLFVFVGPNDASMSIVLNNLLNENLNTIYFGNISKNRIKQVYQLFGCVIVPYKQNSFMQNTRPIKIVESVCCGTPVVTIPMRGYQESEFIRFATDVNSFSNQIDEALQHPIVTDSAEYQQFIRDNCWAKKAEVIMASFMKYKRED